MTDPPALPPDLVARGYRLRIREDGHMNAISPRWGCTDTCADVATVVKQARKLIGFLEWLEKKQRELLETNKQ